MEDRPQPKSSPTPTLLEQISTRWPLISDPGQFVLRYAPAIRRYLGALLPDPHEADEATQDFLLKAMTQHFSPERINRGRFRDYLKVAVRNAAITRFRKKNRATGNDDVLATVADPGDDAPTEADKQWLGEWRQCLLDRVWQNLEMHERRNPTNCFYSALKLATEDPSADSVTLAERTSARRGRTVSAEAFRQQLSRGRKQFASLLVDEVKRTLEGPTPAGVVEELTDLGLLSFVKPYLPPEYADV